MPVTQKNAAKVRDLLEQAERQAEALQVIGGWQGKGTISVRNQNHDEIVTVDVNANLLKQALGAQLEWTQGLLAAAGVKFDVVA